MLSALILPVAEIEVVEILDTVIRPVTDAFDVEKFETNIDVEFNLGIVADTAVNAVVTEIFAAEIFAGLNVVDVKVVTERVVMDALLTLRLDMFASLELK